MAHIIVKPADTYQKRYHVNKLAADHIHKYAVKPAHIYVDRELVWVGKTADLAYLRWTYLIDTQLKLKGTKITGASFPMRVVDTDHARMRLLVARTDGWLFFNWFFHRCKVLLRKQYYWFRAHLILAYENWYYDWLLADSVVNIPRSNSGLHLISIHESQQAETVFLPFRAQYVGGEFSPKKRVFVIGQTPDRSHFLVARADGIHYLSGLWKCWRLRRKPNQIAALLEGKNFPEITVTKRPPSLLQKLLQKLWRRPKERV